MAVIVLERVAGIDHHRFAVDLLLGFGWLRRFPHQSRRLDKLHAAEFLDEHRVGGFHHGGVVPFARRQHAEALAAQIFQIDGRYGQVILVDLDAEFTASLQGLRGKKFLRTLGGIAVV